LTKISSNHKPHLFQQVQVLLLKIKLVPLLWLVQATRSFAVITKIWMPVSV